MRGPQQTSIASPAAERKVETEYGDPFFKGQVEDFPLPLSARHREPDRFDAHGLQGADDFGRKNQVWKRKGEPSKFEKWLTRVFGDKLMNVLMVIATVFGRGARGCALFMLPTWLFNLLGMAAPQVGESQLIRSIFEGALRIVIFLLYVVFCSKMPEIRRVFEYHGAEHKTIFCYENEEELTVENVRKYRRFHPRCGTSFMVIMLMLGIVIGFFIPFSNALLRTLIKILCIPLLMSIGYELIRLCGRYDNVVTRVIAAPGMWMQRITPKEPDDGMIEVAISALKAVIPENGEDKIKA